MNITNQQQATIQSDYIDMVLGVTESDTILCLSAELASNGDIANYHATQSMLGNLAYLACKHEIAYLPVQGVYAGQTEAAFIVDAFTASALYPDAHTIFPGTGAAMVCVPAPATIEAA